VVEEADSRAEARTAAADMAVARPVEADMAVAAGEALPEV